MHLLLIEDDREAVSFLVKSFREAGHVADSALDGLDGYALARRREPWTSMTLVCGSK